MKNNAINNATNTTIGIEAAAYHLPGEKLEIEAWAKASGISTDQARKVVDNGCKYFYSAVELSEIALAAEATSRLLDETGLAGSDIDLVIHAYSQQFSIPPPPHSLPMEICSRFGFDNALPFGICQLNCVSFIGALEIIDILFAANAQMNTALIVTVDRVFGEKYRLRQHHGVQSDASACTLVTRNCGRNRIGSISIFNDPALFESTDGSKKAKDLMSIRENFHTVKVLERTLEAEKYPYDAYHWVIPQNSDPLAWPAIMRSVGIPAERLFLENMADKGHACCSDLSINLCDLDLLKNNLERPILLCAQSNVGAYGSFALTPLNANLH